MNENLHLIIGYQLRDFCNPYRCDGRDISTTDYQDHHQPKTEDEGPRSILSSFLDSGDLRSFLRSFLDSSGGDLRNNPLILACFAAKIIAL